jgi:hypothetical protein
MLIYKIARHIVITDAALDYSLSCTFPEGNWYIDVVLVRKNHKLAKPQKFKLDPKAPKEVSLTTAFRIAG